MIDNLCIKNFIIKSLYKFTKIFKFYFLSIISLFLFSSTFVFSFDTTAKSAIQGLTRALARDLGPKNIRVNCVVPGWIMTERQVEVWLTPESEKELMERQCIKRKLVPEDIAKFVLFMASDEASACSNQSFIVDGGWL